MPTSATLTKRSSCHPLGEDTVALGTCRVRRHFAPGGGVCKASGELPTVMGSAKSALPRPLSCQPKPSGALRLPREDAKTASGTRCAYKWTPATKHRLSTPGSAPRNSLKMGRDGGRGAGAAYPSAAEMQATSSRLRLWSPGCWGPTPPDSHGSEDHAMHPSSTSAQTAFSEDARGSSCSAARQLRRSWQP